MPIVVDSRRKSAATLSKAHPGAVLIDVTSRGPEPWVRFSPFFPHGKIPIPFSPGRTAASVEGLWQGLKVFEKADVDPTRFDVVSMSGLKRSVRKFGPVRGHRRGVGGPELLDYLAARYAIYLPSYRYVLEHHLVEQLAELSRISASASVVLLDYETNQSVTDLSKPLSHAGLIRSYLLGSWPAPRA
jgi:hypothetical protein